MGLLLLSAAVCEVLYLNHANIRRDQREMRAHQQMDITALAMFKQRAHGSRYRAKNTGLISYCMVEYSASSPAVSKKAGLGGLFLGLS